MGNPGWGWEDMLPYFIRIETDRDFGDQPIHGDSGPIIIQRYKPESWAPVNRVMYEACVELGMREAPDLNGLDAHAGVVGVDAAQPLQGSAARHARHLHPRRAPAAQPHDPRQASRRSRDPVRAARPIGVA